jgi:hypothetical protein
MPKTVPSTDNIQSKLSDPTARGLLPLVNAASNSKLDADAQ